MKTITVSNAFHDTETTIKAKYIFDNDEGRVAKVDPAELARGRKVLCGMDGCECGPLKSGVDEDGEVCSLVVLV
jgi:hypothetical protein